MEQLSILETDTLLIRPRRNNRWISFVELERRFRKYFPKETKDKRMIRCFDGLSDNEVQSYWR